MKLGELAQLVGGSIPEGTDQVEVSGVAALRDALSGDISFLANPKYANQVAESRASAIFVKEDFMGDHASAVLVRVASPDKAFAEIVPHFTPAPIVRKPGIHSTAVIGEGVVMGEDVHIGAYAVVGDGTIIGDRVVIEAHVVVGEECIIGDDSHFYPQSSVRERCKIGKRVILYNGAVIGSDGFGYTTEVCEDGRINVQKIPQMGIVELCDDVEIGSNTTVDRARFGVTKIGRMTKIDNLVQIAHNVQIGEYCGIVANVGIAGSTHLGNGVMLWGQVGLAGHITLADGVEVLARSGVSNNLEKGVYFGTPAVPRRDALRQLHIPKTVDNLKNEVAELKAKLKSLEESL